jgi:uncharacterized protein YqcC (DUF446 family)
MNKYDHELADLLLAIEAEMRRNALWESQAPDDQALASLMPFCHDTMSFSQWLQWVFLPRMKEVLESQQDYPASSDIHPLAEYSLAEHGEAIDELLALIARFDAFINRS